MCGIIGVIGSGDDNASWAAYQVYRGLLTLQHRGQDGCGILSYDSARKKFRMKKDLGLVANVFHKERLDKLQGNMAIGHTRYSTIGTNDEDDLQPIVSGSSNGVGMAHNGNIINHGRIKELLANKYHQHLLTDNDLELVIGLWTACLAQAGDLTFEKMKRAAAEIADNLVGAYSVIGLVAGRGLFAFKDSSGIRPLVLGKKEDGGYCVCSETQTLKFLGHTYMRDLAPGEFVFIDNNGRLFSTILDQMVKRKAACMFEWVYFSSAEGHIEGESVYGARLQLGHLLGKMISKRNPDIASRYDIVVPIPDTARPAAISLAETLGIPYREALIKNRYIQRSFILGSKQKREDALLLKLSPVMGEIKGKRILLVDDSIVRGTTSKRIISLLKDCGAAGVGVASTCPPIRYPCYYGIDFPTSQELVAGMRHHDEIAYTLGIEDLFYLNISDLPKAIGVDGICKACLDGNYPTATDSAVEFCQGRV